MKKNISDTRSFLGKKLSFSLGVSIGLFSIFIIALISGWLYIHWINYLDSFYSVGFKIDFLEGILPGMKIRYQGGMIIGEIDRVESKNSENIAWGKVQKNFQIPREKSVLSIQTWGYFGGKFINIDVFGKNHFNFYLPNEIITVRPATNTTEIFRTANNFLKVKNGVQDIEVEVLQLRKSTKNIRKNKFVNPGYVNKFLGSFLNKTNNILSFINKKENLPYDSILKNDFLRKINYNLIKKNISKLRKRTNKFKKETVYNQGVNFFYGETNYEVLVEYVNFLSRKTKEFKEQPHLIFLKNG